jgi:hypothetical protein
MDIDNSWRRRVREDFADVLRCDPARIQGQDSLPKFPGEAGFAAGEGALGLTQAVGLKTLAMESAAASQQDYRAQGQEVER